MKKAQSQYLSWIIIIALVVTISVLLYNWSIEQAEKTGQQLEQRTDPLICAEVGLSVDGICQNFKNLEINITNTGKYEIEGFQLRYVGLYPEDDDFVSSEMITKRMSPDESEKIKLLNKNTLSQIQIIPFALKDSSNVYCEEKAITKENIGQC